MIACDTENISITDLCLHGKKVLLRPFVKEDLQETYLDWLNDDAVVQFSNQRFIHHDYENASRYLASFKGTQNIFMSVRLLSSDQPIGTITAYLSSHHGTVDVGIMIGDKRCWGQGYGQDAWDTMLTWLLQQPGIRKLTAGTSAKNSGMIRLMERSGMELECRRRDHEIIEGSPTDILCFAKFSEA